MGKYKYLIVGQGLAGTVLSHVLTQNNLSHKVLDNGHKTAATKAAAGIINPITGRRYVKSWLIDELLPAADEIYASFEKLLRDDLVVRSSIIRTFANNEQQNLWNESTSRPGYDKYVGERVAEGIEDLIGKPFGSGIIEQAMKVDVAKLIIAYSKHLEENGLLVVAALRHKSVDPSSMVHEIQGDEYENLIFCEGYRAIENPWFQHLPFQPAKGESLTVRIEGMLPEFMIRDNIFIAPNSRQEFWTGGGYEWEDLSEQPSTAFRTSWNEKLAKLLKVSYSIKGHRAGVRPSVKGRRPLIGTHPSYPSIHIFNGMGTKGTSLAPYWAEKFVQFLKNEAPLSAEVDIKRFLG